MDDFLYQLNLLRSLAKPLNALGIRYKQVLRLADEIDPDIKSKVETLIHRCVESKIKGLEINFDLDKEINEIILTADDLNSGDRYGQ